MDYFFNFDVMFIIYNGNDYSSNSNDKSKIKRGNVINLKGKFRRNEILKFYKKTHSHF